MGMLARKGYPAGLAYQVVREVLEQERSGDALMGLDEMADTAAADEWSSE
jgi:hypothetical protein